MATGQDKLEPSRRQQFCSEHGANYVFECEACVHAADKSGIKIFNIKENHMTIAHDPSVAGLLKFFAYRHLPPHLQVISRSFSEQAHFLANTLPSNAETTVALRKLLEAKDCAVRAVL